MHKRHFSKVVHKLKNAKSNQDSQVETMMKMIKTDKSRAARYLFNLWSKETNPDFGSDSSSESPVRQSLKRKRRPTLQVDSDSSFTLMDGSDVLMHFDRQLAPLPIALHNTPNKRAYNLKQIAIDDVMHCSSSSSDSEQSNDNNDTNLVTITNAKRYNSVMCIVARKMPARYALRLRQVCKTWRDELDASDVWKHHFDCLYDFRLSKHTIQPILHFDARYRDSYLKGCVELCMAGCELINKGFERIWNSTLFLRFIGEYMGMKSRRDHDGGTEILFYVPSPYDSSGMAIDRWYCFGNDCMIQPYSGYQTCMKWLTSNMVEWIDSHSMQMA